MLFGVRHPNRLWSRMATCLTVVLWVAGCSSPGPKVATSSSPLHLTATIQDLMEGQIDPSADALWDSVAFIASTSGTEDRQPRTDAEWQAVRVDAITLIEAMNLLRLPGRRVKIEPSAAVGLGELSAAEIQQKIHANPENFSQFALLLQGAGLQALAAIDAKDAQGLMDAGGVIDAACEACHITYWYPNQKRPGTN
jgi:hypothetical protein